jgi:CRP-like cAMP-binding protein
MISDALLKSVYLFADLDGGEREAFGEIAEAMTLPAGYTIFATGDPATALFLIQDGTVRIMTSSPEAKTIDIATLGSGSHFGEMALLDGARRSATAQTLEPTRVFRFEYDKIRGLLDREPKIAGEFYRSLARFLSNRLRQTTTDMSYAREKNIRYF